MPKKGEKWDYSKPMTSVTVKRSDEGEIQYAENGMPIKPPGKRPDNLVRNKEHTKPGDNARYLRHSLAAWNLPVLDISDPEAVRDRIFWYFEHCADADMKPTVTGLALALGTTTVTLREWTEGRSRRETHMEMIRQAKMIIEDQMNSYMENGKINPVAGIFLLKNHFGYKDQQETIITPNTTMGDVADANELKAKYMDRLTEPDYDSDEE